MNLLDYMYFADPNNGLKELPSSLVTARSQLDIEKLKDIENKMRQWHHIRMLSLNNNEEMLNGPPPGFLDGMIRKVYGGSKFRRL